MDFGEMVVIIVAISCAAGVVHKFLDVLAIRGKSGADRKFFQHEFAALRRDVAELRQWANDLILSFDSTLHQQTARIQTLERRALSEGRADAALRGGHGEVGAEAEAVEPRMRR